MKLYSVKEVMAMTGVSRDMLIDYEKRGLLHPLRTGDVANNRRMYREEDIEVYTDAIRKLNCTKRTPRNSRS